MFLTAIFIVMAVFATVSNWISRRNGSAIARRPYGNIYSDATAARRTPPSPQDGAVSYGPTPPASPPNPPASR
jgi:hypothetical protein